MGVDPGEIYSPGARAGRRPLNAANFRFDTATSHLVGSGSLKQKACDNFAAIELSQLLDREAPSHGRREAHPGALRGLGRHSAGARLLAGPGRLRLAFVASRHRVVLRAWLWQPWRPRPEWRLSVMRSRPGSSIRPMGWERIWIAPSTNWTDWPPRSPPKRDGVAGEESWCFEAVPGVPACRDGSSGR